MFTRIFFPSVEFSFLLPMLVFCLWYEVNSAAFESNKKCATFKTGQHKLVYPFPFFTTRTFNQGLNLPSGLLQHPCKLQAKLYPPLPMYMKMQQLWTSCLWCLPLNEPSLYASLDSHFVLSCLHLVLLSFFSYVIFYCIVRILSTLLMVITPFFSFLGVFLPVNCSFLPYYSTWRFSVQNLSVTYHAKSILRTSSSRKFFCSVGFNQDNSIVQNI